MVELIRFIIKLCTGKIRGFRLLILLAAVVFGVLGGIIGFNSDVPYIIFAVLVGIASFAWRRYRRSGSGSLIGGSGGAGPLGGYAAPGSGPGGYNAPGVGFTVPGSNFGPGHGAGTGNAASPYGSAALGAPGGTVPGAPGAIPPNWYPDPQNQSMVRWWDGQAWTPHAQPRKY